MLERVLRWVETRQGFWTALVGVTAASAILRLIRMTQPGSRLFDEVYSPVFAQKFLHGEAFFDVHPFLAQFPTVLGLLLFGDTPLGWRFGPWLWGVFFSIGIGVLGYLLTGRRLTGILAALLAAVDVAMFVYGRTGLPDMFLLATLAWALALFFLSTRLSSAAAGTRAIVLSGVLFGNLLATKWLGLVGLGLAWLWIALLFAAQRTRPSLATPPRAEPHAAPRTPPLLYPVPFLLIPLLTYLVWFIPIVGIPGLIAPAVGEAVFQQPECRFGPGTQDRTRPPAQTWVARVRHWHCVVWNYHAYLKDTHPYGSPWWSWPLLKHPVLFHLDTTTTPPRRVSANGNPAVWITGLAVVHAAALSLLASLRRSVRPRQVVLWLQLVPVTLVLWAALWAIFSLDVPHRQPLFHLLVRLWTGGMAIAHVLLLVFLARRRAGTANGQSAPRETLVITWLVLGVLAAWLPWALIQRVTFHYHYFVSFTLTLLLLAIWLTELLDRRRLRPIALVYLGIAFLGFVYLYPTATATSAFWVR